MNVLTTSIQRLFKKKVDKKNELFTIFKEYIKTVNKLNSLKRRESYLEIKKIQNQIDEYFIPLSDLNSMIDLNLIEDEKIISKVKHISEIHLDSFTFADLYATPTEEGVLLTAEKKQLSELVRVVSYKKVK